MRALFFLCLAPLLSAQVPFVSVPGAGPVNETPAPSDSSSQANNDTTYYSVDEDYINESGDNASTPPPPLSSVNGDNTQMLVQSQDQQSSTKEANQSLLCVSNAGRASYDNLRLKKEGNISSSKLISKGVNAAIQTITGGHLQIDGGFITTKAVGATALYAKGGNTQVLLDGVGFSTWQSQSTGLYFAQGAQGMAYKCTVCTQGLMSPAIKSGNWTGLKLWNLRVLTTNEASPAIQSSGSVMLQNSVLSAQQSPCIIMEAQGELRAKECKLSTGGNIACLLLRSTQRGGAEGAPINASLKQITLDSAEAPYLMVTNTPATLSLKGVLCSGQSTSLLQARGYIWGEPNYNGAQVTLTASGCQLRGDIGVDGLSQAQITFTDGTQFTGTLGGAGSIHLSLQTGTQLTLTADAYVTQLDFSGSTLEDGLKGIQSGGFTLYYKADYCPELGGKTYELQGGGKLTPQTQPELSPQ